jgi:hypothetical protein
MLPVKQPSRLPPTLRRRNQGVFGSRPHHPAGTCAGRARGQRRTALTASVPVEVTFWESLEDLEPRIDKQCVAVLREYCTFKKMAVYKWRQPTPVLYFEPYERAICPRIAVAQ